MRWGHSPSPLISSPIWNGILLGLQWFDLASIIFSSPFSETKVLWRPVGLFHTVTLTKSYTNNMLLTGFGKRCINKLIRFHTLKRHKDHYTQIGCRLEKYKNEWLAPLFNSCFACMKQGLLIWYIWSKCKGLILASITNQLLRNSMLYS